MLSSYIFTYIFICNSVRPQHKQTLLNTTHVDRWLTPFFSERKNLQTPKCRKTNKQNKTTSTTTVQFYKNVFTLVTNNNTSFTDPSYWGQNKSLHIYFLNSVTFCWCVLIIMIITTTIIIIILYGVTNKTALKASTREMW